MIEAKVLGERIRFYRTELGLAQSELAEKIHVSFQAVSSWECGKTLPDLENLCALTETLGVSADRLLQNQLSSDELAFIGIDGGGTSTEFALFTTSGRILKCFKLEGSNASSIGLTNALAIFYRGIDRCLAANSNVSGIFMGCAGGFLQDVVEELSKRYPEIPIQIDSDGVNALLSSDGDAAMICGTGMVFFRHEDGGGYKKFAGWGYKYGDFGSAYNFGRATVREALAVEDGLDGSLLIYSILKKKTGCQAIRELTKSLKEVSQVAELACVVFEAYDKGDAYAREIVHAEQKELARIAGRVCPEGGKIIACGGINTHYGRITLPILKEYAPKNIEFVLPKLPPIYGACREACRRFGAKMGAGFFENFLSDYKK